MLSMNKYSTWSVRLIAGLHFCNELPPPLHSPPRTLPVTLADMATPLLSILQSPWQQSGVRRVCNTACRPWQHYLHDLQPLGDVFVHLLQFGLGGLSLHLHLRSVIQLTEPFAIHFTLHVKGGAVQHTYHLARVRIQFPSSSLAVPFLPLLIFPFKGLPCHDARTNNHLPCSLLDNSVAPGLQPPQPKQGSLTMALSSFCFDCSSVRTSSDPFSSSS